MKLKLDTQICVCDCSHSCWRLIHLQFPHWAKEKGGAEQDDQYGVQATKQSLQPTMGSTTTVHYDPLQSTTIHYSPLQCRTVHYSPIQSTTVHYDPLRSIQSCRHYSPPISFFAGTHVWSTLSYQILQEKIVQSSQISWDAPKYPKREASGEKEIFLKPSCPIQGAWPINRGPIEPANHLSCRKQWRLLRIGWISMQFVDRILTTNKPGGCHKGLFYRARFEETSRASGGGRVRGREV